MLPIRLSPLAQADLDGIWTYTATQWDEAQAQSYLMGIDTTMKLLADNPRMGSAISDIREGYFKFPAASHLLIYRLLPDAIVFMRILHRQMDVERHV